MKYQLTVRFAGVCTHFRHGVVAGVPHRVVLPDASQIKTGLLTVRAVPVSHPKPAFYYLLPHFAQIEVAGADSAKLFVPPLVQDGAPAMSQGDLLTGLRLQVRNTIEREMVYRDDKTPKLLDYDPEYAISGDVVFGGRAACYFDFFGGNVSSLLVSGGAMQTIVQLTTDGAPELLVTPLASSHAPTRSFVLPLPVEENMTELSLVVKNLEPMLVERGDQMGGAFDFLLHYLTARGGIPQVISKVTPGMSLAALQAPSLEDFADALRALAALATPTDARRELRPPDEVTPSCSDSQYP